MCVFNKNNPSFAVFLHVYVINPENKYCFRTGTKARRLRFTRDVCVGDTLHLAEVFRIS